MQNEKTANAANVEAANVESVELRYYKARPDVTIKSEIGRAVARSYENPAVALARKARKGCIVRRADEPESAARHYASVRKAFDGEGINLNGHIPFRGRLRKVGQLSLFVENGKISGTREGTEYLFIDAEAKLADPEAADPEAADPEAADPEAADPEAAKPRRKRRAK